MKNSTMKTTGIFAAKLADLIKRKGFTKKHFAETVEITQPVVTDWCGGENLPSRDKIAVVCGYFDPPDDVALARAWVRDCIGHDLSTKLFKSSDHLPRTMELPDKYYDAVSSLVDGMLRSEPVREAVLHVAAIAK